MQRKHLCYFTGKKKRKKRLAFSFSSPVLNMFVPPYFFFHQVHISAWPLFFPAAREDCN